MENLLEQIQYWLLSSFFQLFSILGVFFVFGIVLYFLAKTSRTIMVKSLGEKADVYFTGWIGTPVHELSHAIMCILFRHRITEMKLFSPNTKDKTLGYVNHAYNPKNPYHQIGNFFIGMAPIIIGSGLLWLLVCFLLNQPTAIYQFPTLEWGTKAIPLRETGMAFYTFSYQWVSNFLSVENMHHWKFWVFIYLAMAIASHMELSPSDIKGMGSGLLTIAIIVFIAKGISIFLGIEWDSANAFFNKVSVMAGAVFTLSALISLLNVVLAYIVLAPVFAVKYKRVLNPFF